MQDPPSSGTHVFGAPRRYSGIQFFLIVAEIVHPLTNVNFEAVLLGGQDKIGVLFGDSCWRTFE